MSGWRRIVLAVIVASGGLVAAVGAMVRWPTALPWVMAGLAVATLIGFLALVIVQAPPLLIERRVARLGIEEATPEDRLKAENDLRTSLLQAISALALVAGVVFTFQQVTQTQRATQRQLVLTEQQQQSDRFTRAVTQIGAGTSDVRLGGIYALERIGLDSAFYRPAVTGILAAYLRERVERPKLPDGSLSPPQPVDPSTPGGLTPDEQAALTVLARWSLSWRGSVPSLKELDLRSADLRDARLQGAALGGADLRNADLTGADLRGANLRGALLSPALFSRTDLRGADLSDADLRQQTLRDASLRGAVMIKTDLREAWLSGADLRGVDMRGADMRDSLLRDIVTAYNDPDKTPIRLSGADLRGANLGNVDLRGASLVYEARENEGTHRGLRSVNLQDADLSGAVLCGVNLRGLSLSGVKLAEAGADAKTKWPVGFDPARAGVVDTSVNECAAF